MSFGFIPERFVQSRPHQVYWAGFRSDTFTLQQNGWEFAADQRIERDEIALVMRHRELGIHAVTSGVPGIMHALDDQRFGGHHFNVRYLTDRSMKFHYHPADMVRVVEHASPVDMRPTLAMAEEMKDIEDFKIFACPLVRTNEVIVDPHSVPDLMGRILELQDPARKEHFLAMAKEARAEGADRYNNPGPRQKFHAQIVSIAA